MHDYAERSDGDALAGTHSAGKSNGSLRRSAARMQSISFATIFCFFVFVIIYCYTLISIIYAPCSMPYVLCSRLYALYSMLYAQYSMLYILLVYSISSDFATPQRPKFNHSQSLL